MAISTRSRVRRGETRKSRWSLSTQERTTWRRSRWADWPLRKTRKIGDNADAVQLQIHRVPYGIDLGADLNLCASREVGRRHGAAIAIHTRHVICGVPRVDAGRYGRIWAVGGRRRRRADRRCRSGSGPRRQSARDTHNRGKKNGSHGSPTLRSTAPG